MDRSLKINKKRNIVGLYAFNFSRGLDISCLVFWSNVCMTIENNMAMEDQITTQNQEQDHNGKRLTQIDHICRESCEHESFNGSYLQDSFLGIYIKTYELATIFLRP